MKALTNSLIYVAGELFAKAIPFLFLPYLTRSLGVVKYGELSMVLVWISLASIAISLSQNGALSRAYFRYGKNVASLIGWAGHIYSLLVGVFIFIAGYWFGIDNIILIVASSYFFNSILVQLAFFTCAKEATSYVFVQIFSSILGVVFTVILFEFIMPSVEYRILSTILAYIFALCGVFFLGKGFYSKVSLRKIKLGIIFVLSYGGPLIFHQLSTFGKGAFDRIFVDSYFSSFELGIYSSAYQLAFVVQLTLISVNRALVPYYYEAVKEKRITVERILVLARYSVLFPILVGAFLFLFQDAFFVFLLGEEFSGVKGFVHMFCVGFSVNLPYFIMVNYFFYMGKTSKVAAMNVISTLIYVFGIWVLSNFGIEYLPLSLMVSNIFLVLMLYIALTRYRRENV